MLRGLYMAGCGMMAEAARNDVVANNLANVNTTGFKKDNVALRAFPELLIRRINDKGDLNPLTGLLEVTGNHDHSLSEALAAMLAGNPPIVGTLNTGTLVDEVRTFYDNGVYRATGRKLDLAIAGEGMLVVETLNGERYTRNGALLLTPEGRLVTGEGYQVLGQNGPITIDPAGYNEEELLIKENGALYLNGEWVEQLRVVTFPDYTQLRKQGDSLFYLMEDAAIQPEVVAQPQIQSGFLEQANVNPVQEMVKLINVYRAYEANQKVVQAYDSTLEKAVNEVGRL